MLHTGYGNGSVRPVDAAALVEHFEIHGWVVLRDVLATAQLAELKAAFEALLPPTLMPALPHSDGIPHPIEPSRRHPAFARWLAVAGPFDAAARCLGSARVQLLQDDLLVKRPGADDTLAWHQDASYLGGLDPLRSVSIRFALDRETPESGCMWVIDGSHRIRSVTPFSQDAPRRVEDALADATATLRRGATARTRGRRRQHSRRVHIPCKPRQSLAVAAPHARSEGHRERLPVRARPPAARARAALSDDL